MACSVPNQIFCLLQLLANCIALNRDACLSLHSTVAERQSSEEMALRTAEKLLKVLNERDPKRVPLITVFGFLVIFFISYVL